MTNKIHRIDNNCNRMINKSKSYKANIKINKITKILQSNRLMTQNSMIIKAKLTNSNKIFISKITIQSSLNLNNLNRNLKIQ